MKFLQAFSVKLDIPMSVTWQLKKMTKKRRVELYIYKMHAESGYPQQILA
jgi:hypothetical protein